MNKLHYKCIEDAPSLSVVKHVIERVPHLYTWMTCISCAKRPATEPYTTATVNHPHLGFWIRSLIRPSPINPQTGLLGVLTFRIPAVVMLNAMYTPTPRHDL